MRDFETVKDVVKALFYDMEHPAEVSEVKEEAKVLYEGMLKYAVSLRVEEILQGIEKIGYLYACLTDTEKAELFRFKPDDNGYNLKLYFAVQKAVGANCPVEKCYGDYQRMYDKTMEMQVEKEVERKEERGR